MTQDTPRETNPPSPAPRKSKSASALFGLWAVLAVILGAALMSLHQPFVAPQPEVLALLPPTAPGHWRAVHILSTSCGCSQRVMRHLLQRHLDQASEQILLVDSNLPTLPESPALLAHLARQGFPITHIAANSIPPSLHLHGVPLLVLASPQNQIAYLGGYGVHSDADIELLAQARAGQSPAPLPILGCAFSSTLQRQADPFGLKY